MQNIRFETLAECSLRFEENTLHCSFISLPARLRVVCVFPFWQIYFRPKAFTVSISISIFMSACASLFAELLQL